MHKRIRARHVPDISQQSQAGVHGHILESCENRREIKSIHKSLLHLHGGVYVGGPLKSLSQFKGFGVFAPGHGVLEGRCLWSTASAGDYCA